MENNEYFAFISYKREDEEWARWLQNELERYRLPSSIRKNNSSLPSYLRPIFRDSTELSGGVLTEKLNEALNASKFLIVICSPRAAQSMWVNEEVESFISSGRLNRIVPFIVEGVPNAKNPREECFPASLRRLSPNQELLGVSVHEMGKDAAVVKVVAQMLGLKFDSLWQRQMRHKRKITTIVSAASLSLAIVGLVIGWSFWNKNKYIGSLNQELLAEETRFVSKNAETLLADADTYKAMRIAQCVLPKNVDNPERPYLPEAESILRSAYYANIHRICDYSQRSVFSPSGKYLLTTRDGVKVWDVFSGQLVYEIPNFYPSAISDDWTRMVSDVFVSIEILDFLPTLEVAETPQQCQFARDSLHSELCTSSARSLAMSSEKNRIFSAHLSFILDEESDLMGTRIIMWDIPSKRVLWSSICANEEISRVVFSSDGKYVCGVCDDFSIKVWNAANGKLICSFRGHTDTINDICFYPNEPKIITASDDGMLKIWDLERKRMIKTLAGHYSKVTSLVISSDERTIISVDKGGLFIIWDALTGEQIRQVPSGFLGIQNLSSSKDGNLLAFGCSTGTYILELYNEKHSAVLIDSLSSVNVIRYDPSGEELIVGSGEQKIIAFDSSSKEVIWEQSYTGIPGVFKEDLNDISFTSNGTAFISNLDSLIVEWDCCSGQEKSVFNFGEKVFSVAQSPDAKYIVISSVSGVSVWRQEDKLFLYRLKEITYDRGGNYAFNSQNGTFSSHDYIWDLATGSVQYIQPRDEFATGSYLRLKRNVFSPDGQMFVMASSSWGTGEFEVRRTSDGEMIRPIKCNHYWGPGVCVFSPDSKLLVCGDGGGIRIWDIHSGVLLCELSSFEDSPADFVTMLDFCPDGRHIASCTQSGKIRIWSYPSLQEILDDVSTRFANNPLTLSEIDKYIHGERIEID